MPDLGWECPTGCGECCYHPGDFAKPYREDGFCKNWSDDGCTLPRWERPRVCLDYLCPEVAKNTKDYLRCVV
jgi:hypothetical protein